MRDLAWTVPLWPLAGWLILGALGGRLPRRVVSAVGTGSVALAFVAALAAARAFPGEPVVRTFFTWIAAGRFSVDAGFLVDRLALVMMLVVTGVGLLIHIYSIGYMGEDPAYSRYFAYLNLFMGSMLLLVMGSSLLVLFVGWELVGLCSYLLIGFWFARDRAADAGRKAFVVNRIGDAGFLLGILVLWTAVGSLDLATLNARAPGLAPGVALTAGLLLFLGATGKSAQLPLYTWLPDAMEGPTPVSALIHAATMVTAGVYVVARLFPLFDHAVTLSVIAGVGALTALFAATIALVEWDLKRVLAYSTISQLGYMFLALGVLAPAASIFHLTTHAFFKALLFLAAGSVMHAMGGEIDMRRLGGLAQSLRLTTAAFAIGALALAGIPPFAGFVSKDLILERAMEHALAGGSPFPVVLGLVTAFVTAVYVTRAMLHTFMAPASWSVPPGLGAAAHGRLVGHGTSDHESAHLHEAPHDAPPVMAGPMAVLAALAFGGGLLGASLARAPLLSFLAPQFPEVLRAAEPAAGGAVARWSALALSLLMAFAGALVGVWRYRGGREPHLGWLRDAAAGHWGLIALYDRGLVPAAARLARLLSGPIDLGAIDAAINGIGGALLRIAGGLRRLQTGYVRQYAAILLAGIVLVMIYWVMR